MGIAKSVANWLVREQLRQPFQGTALIFGRQSVHVTLDEVRAMMLEVGLVPRPLRPGLSERSDLDPTTPYTNDAALFWTIAGVEVEHLDGSDYERAEHVCDLNRAVPSDLRGRFGLVFDCGTMEHVFDVRSTLQNIDALARRGGRVLHVTQGSNWLEHGYYQFSPVLFYDFYGVNGYEDMHCWVADQGRGDSNRTRWDWYPWPSDRSAPAFLSDNPVGLFFSGVRGADAAASRLPQQCEYSGKSAFGASPATPGRSWRARVPRPIREVGRSLYWRMKREGHY